jgi:DNA polymerase I-like protein with 3'-5' exonuclease and polymerase domains
MIITLAERQIRFTPWRPSDGVVFPGAYALDTETTLLDSARPDLTPDLVLAAVSDGRKGYFVAPANVPQFLMAHPDQVVVFHNAPFDLRVIQKQADELKAGIDVYDRVEHNLVYDTQLLHRLYTLATEGHTCFGKGQATLEHCCRRYLDIDLPKALTDSAGNDVRLSWARYLGKHPREIDSVYLEYLGKDAMATFALYGELTKRIGDTLADGREAFGYVSANWLAEQTRRWGPQTHHIQLRAAIALERMTALGIGVDVAAARRRLEELDVQIAEKAAALRRREYVPGPGSSDCLQRRIARVLNAHPHIELSRTETGKYATDEEALAVLARCDPFFRDLADYRAASKRKKTYLEKLTADRIHPGYDVLKNTGRTSSRGAINIQNLPRDNPKDPAADPGVRGCFVPAAGHVFYDCDYKMIELVTLAQSAQGQLGVSSKMAEAINAGQDLHKLVAGQATGKPPDQVTAEERQAAKALNFGLPGGLGVQTLRQYAAATYGVTLDEEEARAWMDQWFATFPEMRDFLDGGGSDVGLEIARFFDLTPAEFNAAVGRPSYHANPDDHEPQAWLAGMLLKALSEEAPTTNNGRPYSAEELHYFRTRALECVNDLPRKAQTLLRKNTPDPRLKKLLRDHFGRAPVFTLSGRLRAAASYCARHNTLFQGLAADGAKLALWKLWRAGYRVVAFVHDQVLVEVPDNADLTAVAADIKELMIVGMRQVVPDVKVDLDGGFKRRWTKDRADRVVVTEMPPPVATAPQPGLPAQGEGGTVATAVAEIISEQSPIPHGPAYPGAAEVEISSPLSIGGRYETQPRSRAV